VGLGDVTRDDGWVLMFHCIAIADGSRDIEVGTDVEFDVICKLGRYEADHLTPT
jgi:cold shock CspA family protein